MAVYGDDPHTPADEGAEPGDHISFTVNGRPALELGPDPAMWTGNGDRWEVNLGAKTGWRCQLLEDVELPCNCLVDDDLVGREVLQGLDLEGRVIIVDPSLA
jgi:hypothetical protein